MQYELYADSLFFVNFAMNFYILLLVDRMTLRTATRGKLILGAGIGAIGFLLPFLLSGSLVLRLIFGVLAGTVGMLLVTFRVTGIRGFFTLYEKTLKMSFAFGGGLLLLMRLLQRIVKGYSGVLSIALLGGVLALFFRYRNHNCKERELVCKAVLRRGENRVTVDALIDTGNSLTEPISGKPVCVVDRDIYTKLWKDQENGYRVIPYHSVGNTRGLMEGYLLPELWIEIQGIRKKCKEIYIAVSPESISKETDGQSNTIKMIIHPDLLN